MRQVLSALTALLGGLLLCCGPASAQAPKRVALVIGNADYRHVSPLQSADSDAAALAEALGRLGFDVKRLFNADLASMRGALDEFQRRAADADAALIFFAGHSLRQRGAGRLVPVDATLQDGASVERNTLPIDQVSGALARAHNGFLLVEGCADARLAERLQWAGGAEPGLGQPVPRRGTLIAIASADERGCAARVFVDSLLVEIEEPGLDAGRLFRRTQQLVAFRSGGAQEVALSAGLANPFFFAREDLPAPAFRRLGVDPAVEAMRGHIGKYGSDPLTPVVKAALTEKESLQARAGAREATRAWNGWIDDNWSRARAEKARASRAEALEARWSREAEAAQQAPKGQRLAMLTPPPMPPPVIAPAPPPVPVPTPAPPPKVEESAAPRPQPPTVPAAPPAPPPPEPKAATPAPPVTLAEKPALPPALKLEDAIPPPPAAPPPIDQKMASLTAPTVPPSSVPAPPPPAKPEEAATPRPEPQHAAPAAPAAAPAPAAPAPTPSEPNTASLATPPAAPPPPPFNPDSVESVKAAQQELRRLGCYAGDVDGMTGPRTKNALASAAGKLGPSSGVDPLTEPGLRALRDYKGVLCPPAVVVKAVPAPAPAAPAPAQNAPPVATPAPASPPPPPPTPVVQNPPPAPAAPAPAPAASEKKKIHISM